MQAVIDLWPTCFISLWAYPFIAIPYYRRRRLIMDLVRIGGDNPEIYEQAVRMFRAFQAKLRAELEQEAAGRGALSREKAE